MEKLLSAFQVASAALILLFGAGTAIRCIVMGNDVFYIVMFSAIALVGCMMLRFAIAEYKESRYGNNK